MNKLIKPFTNEYELYLKDESRKIGYADSVSMPRNTEEISLILKECNENNINVTIQGSRTGVGAGAVPLGGHIMSLERLKYLKMGVDSKSVTAGAAVTLNEINQFIGIQTSGKLFLPPDPTEGTASAGGMVCCNSSGARTYGYGSMRNYIERLKIVLPDGRLLNVQRGTRYAKGRSFELTPEGCGSKIVGTLPLYNMPDVKNAAGYYTADDMDMIDLFIGAEGTLGVITEVEFSLEEKPEYIWGAIAFFENEGQGIRFAQSLKALRSKPHESAASEANSTAVLYAEANMKAVTAKTGEYTDNIISIEFFDSGSLDLLREKKRQNPLSLESKALPEEFQEAVFVEIRGRDKEELIASVRLIEIAISQNGGNPDKAWVAGSSRSFQSFKELRHATPECVNEKISEMKKLCPQITKLGSDMSVKDEDFSEIVRLYKSDLEKNKLSYVMFGHIGNNHLHVNIISRNLEEYELGKNLFNKWAGTIGSRNGSISAEHGVGKLKRDYLIKMYGEKSVEEMRNLKKSLDPKGILDRDNIFLWKSE